MSNTQMERKFFWNRYQETLMQNGEPFSLKLNCDRDGTLRHYAYVNARHFTANRCVCIEFTPQCGRVRYGVYLENEVQLFDCLFEQREAIESLLGFNCNWERGTKGKNTRRIFCEQEIVLGDYSSYFTAIEESMVRLTKFVQVFEKLL